MLAQTSQPYDLNIPGLDWSHPAVKWVLLISGVTALILYLFNKVFTPFFVAALKSLGVIKRTWRDELEDRVTEAEEKAVTAEAKAQVVAENVTELNRVVEQSQSVESVPAEVVAKTESVAHCTRIHLDEEDET